MNARVEIAGTRGASIVGRRPNRLTRLAGGAAGLVLAGTVLALLAAWTVARGARAEAPVVRALPEGSYRLPKLVVPAFLGGTPAADADTDGAEDGAEEDADAEAFRLALAAGEPPPRRASPPRAVRSVRQRDDPAPPVAPVWYRPVADGRAAMEPRRAASGGEPRRDAAAVDRVAATRMSDARYWVPRGQALDCTLETAIDSTLGGLATCTVARDVYGATGELVLLARGTRLVGEVGAQVRAGQSRVAVSWSEARTPDGVLVRLDSGGTDALGRAGLPGSVDRHTGERFGAALLLSVVDAALQAAVESQRESGGVVVSPSAPNAIATEVLRETVAIPPTIRVPPGARLQVVAARHLDFSSVYAAVPAAGPVE